MTEPKQTEDRSPRGSVRALYEEAESQSARALEQFVAKPSFGALLARSAENLAALTRIGADLSDLVLRNLRIAGRADIARLARQLHRTEDQVERVLQEVEQLRDELGAGLGTAASNGHDPASRDAASGRDSTAADR